MFRYGNGRLFHFYVDDNAAVKAEAAIVNDLGGSKFRDTEFCGNHALYLDWTRPPVGALPADSVRWGRICDLGVKGMLQPSLFTSSTTNKPTEIIQGVLPDTWFINAMSCLSAHPEELKRIFVSSKNWLHGIYTLRFYKGGRTVYVHVDDRIALNRDGEPLYCRSTDPNEAWPLILEKAYAKLHSCYENLSNGTIDYGLADLTGRFVFNYSLQQPSASAPVDLKLFKRVSLDLANAAIVSASYQPKIGVNLRPTAGIHFGQAYVVEEAAFFDKSSDSSSYCRQKQVSDMKASTASIALVRIRSSWRHLKQADNVVDSTTMARSDQSNSHSAWQGAWSLGDSVWEAHAAIRDALQPDTLHTKSFGSSFWMCWADFVLAFNSLSSAPRQEEQTVTVFEGAWDQAKPRSLPGGCPLFQTFPSNPQYLLRTSQETTLSITLRQPDHRFVRKPLSYNNGIGLVLVRLNEEQDNDTTRLATLDSSKCDIRAATNTFVREREVTLAATVDAGRYVIVPMTYRPQQQEYLLEVSHNREVEFSNDNDSTESLPPPPPIPDIESASIPAVDWVLQETQRVDVEDEGRSIQMLHKEVAHLLDQIMQVKQDVKSMTDKLEYLSASRR